MSARPVELPVKPNGNWELIDAEELATRLNLPVSWIRSHCRNRTSDEVPCLRFGRWVRFRWGSPELEKWLRDHMECRS